MIIREETNYGYFAITRQLNKVKKIKVKVTGSQYELVKWSCIYEKFL